MAEAEQKQPLILSLGRGYNGFYCPETRFHLIGNLRPQGIYPAAVLSEDVKRGLRGGTLVDVNGLLKKEDLAPAKGVQTPINSSERKKAILIQADEIAKQEQKLDMQDENYKDDYVTPNFNDQQGALLSESDIQSASKKELVAFIEKTEELDLEALKLNSRSTLDDMKEALMTHYGYDEKPVDHKED